MDIQWTNGIGKIKYHQSYVRVRKRIGLFKYQDFLIEPGTSRLTQIPISTTPRFPRLYSFWRKHKSKAHRLWLEYSPEWWKKRVRHKSHMKFLDKLSFPNDAKVRDNFGSQNYIEAEKIRVRKLPPSHSEFTGYDPKVGKPVRESIKDAIAEIKGKNSVKG